MFQPIELMHFPSLDIIDNVQSRNNDNICQMKAVDGGKATLGSLPDSL